MTRKQNGISLGKHILTSRIASASVEEHRLPNFINAELGIQQTSTRFEPGTVDARL